MWLAERRHRALVASGGGERGEDTVTIRDGLIMGLWQCVALIPGVSRSGATISGGLFQGMNRVLATELSFFLAIPALTAAGIYEAYSTRNELGSLGVGPMAVGCLASFVVAYASIAWLLRFVANNTLESFIIYRVALGIALIGVLATGIMTAT